MHLRTTVFRRHWGSSLKSWMICGSVTCSLNQASPIWMPVTGYLIEAALLPEAGEELRLDDGGERLRRPTAASRGSMLGFGPCGEGIADIHDGVTKLILSSANSLPT